MKKQLPLTVCLFLILQCFLSSNIFGQGLLIGRLYTPAGNTLSAAAVDIYYGNNTVTVYTDSMGEYQFFVPTNDSVTIVPRKNGVPGGPLNGVDSLDLIEMGNAVLGATNFNLFQFLAGDVNFTGGISTLDLVQTSQVMDGTVSNFPNDVEWKFYSANIDWPANPWLAPMAALDIGPLTVDSVVGTVRQDFIAIKNGDVTLDAATNGINIFGYLHGEVRLDTNTNCLIDSLEAPLSGWLVQAINPAGQLWQSLTDQNGYYSFPVPSDTYDLTVIPPHNLWGLCTDTFFNIQVDTQTIAVNDFPVQVLVNCSVPTVSISTPFLRRCFENTYFVEYANEGTTTLFNAEVVVTLDSFLSYVSSSIPFSEVNGLAYTFPVGDLEPGSKGTFTIKVLSDCEAELGYTHCVEAEINPHFPCEIPLNWDGSQLQVRANCDGDEVTFTVTNIGSNMVEPAGYVIIEDIMIQMIQDGAILLDSGQTEVITLPANGSTWRIEVEQTPNNPFNGYAAAAIEGCGTDSTGTFSLGLIAVFPLADEALHIDTDCRQNIGAFDPNDKQGFPLGVDTEHWVPRDQEMEYLIRFQNTGTDTAFNVVILDTLSNLFDLSTLRTGVSSHRYSYRLLNENVMQFVFPNIMLPDSNVNEPASHGFVRFSVKPIPGLPNGTAIENSAAIYFDFNDPIITNTTLHTFGEQYLSVSIEEPRSGLLKISIWPNPTSEMATVALESDQPYEGFVQLYNNSGRAILRQTFNQNPFTLQVQDLSPGMYFLQLFDRKGMIIGGGKVLIE